LVVIRKTGRREMKKILIFIFLFSTFINTNIYAESNDVSYSVENIDENNDGKTDMRIFWNKNGIINKIIFLSPEDSKPDVRVLSEPQEVIIDNKKLNKQVSINRVTNQVSNVYTEPFTLVFIEISTLRNEKVKIYYKNNLSHRIEIDSNNDGKIDTWGYFEKGLLVRTEKDTNFDGLVDEIK